MTINTLKNVRGWTLMLLLSAIVPISAIAAAMNNEDVVQLVKAGLDEKLIVEAISRSEASFDLSTSALVKLKEAGVSNLVIERMFTHGSSRASAASVTRAPEPKDMVCTDAIAGLIKLRSGDGESTIGFKRGRKESESSGGGRAALSILTLGIISLAKTTHFAVLPGTQAETRTKHRELEFTGLAIERGQSPDDAIKLVSLYEGGANGSYGRTIPIGEGSVSYWGHPQER